MKKKIPSAFYANIKMGLSEFILSLDSTRSDTADFSFLMNQKQIKFGDVSMTQIWMPKETLYGKKNSPDHNRIDLIDFFWECCKVKSTTGDQGVLESCLLAKVLPDTRKNSCAKIFKDSCLEQKRPIKGGEDSINVLDQLIKQSLNEPMTEDEFWNQTNQFLGPGELDDELVALYQEMSEELFPKASECEDIDMSEVYEKFSKKWNEWMIKIGRRRHGEDLKKVLDMLSYEARCAIHRCYSWFWSVFAAKIAELKGCTVEFVRFHQLWHMSPIQEIEAEGRRFHLFHGHVPGLHPAGSQFLNTPTGQEIIGNLIKNPSNENYRKFLRAYAVSCIVYEGELIQSRKEGGQISRRGLHPQLPDDISLDD